MHCVYSVLVSLSYIIVSHDLCCYLSCRNKPCEGVKLDYVFSCRLSSYPRPYGPQCSTFIRTPREIEKKKTIVNVQNRTHNLCFLCSVLAGIHPVARERNPHRLTHYKPHLHELNTTWPLFPNVRSRRPQIRKPQPQHRHQSFGF